VKYTPESFIPPKIDWFTITFFKWYVKYLCKKRFENVWIRTNYKSEKGESTLYLLNHHYWWDGLIPLLLNEYVFKQDARAIMEEKQMKIFPFFSRVGAFSIDRANLKSAMFSLDFAGEWLQGSGNSVYLYPEGKITNTCDNLSIESGFTRILKNYKGFDTVLIALFITYDKFDKPELYIDVSESILLDSDLNKLEMVSLIENELNQRLQILKDSSTRSEISFIKLC
jgi:1-acyl-sn-glycerol-3-phosphate acyltransferase